MNTSFGETLRAAREAKGLTTSQIASKTRMLVQIVEEMENEDFHRIAAPIYGRGFVKLYAECVDLDPLPLVKEFMDIYEGRRAPIVRTREVPVQTPPAAPEPPPAVTPPVPEPQPAPAPEPPPVVIPPPTSPSQEEPSVVAPPPPPAPEEPSIIPPPPVSNPFAQPSEPEPVQEPVPEPPPVMAPPPAPVAPPPPAPEPVQETPPSVRGLELFEASANSRPQEPAPSEPAPAASPAPASRTADIFSDSPYLASETTFGGEGPSAADRFRKSLSSVSHGVIQSVREIPRSVWRITLLIVASLVLLALLAWGCIKLYQATSIAPGQQPQAEVDPNDNTVPNDFSSLKDTKDLKDSKDLKGPKNLKDSKDAKDLKDLKTTKAPQPAAKPGKRPPLRSTGQKVPPLYAD